MPAPPVNLAGRVIGPGAPCFVIAEAGVNHNGDLELALQLVAAAARAGADAVKFQTFRTEDLVTLDAPKAAYQRATTDAAESQFALLKKLELTPAAQRAIQAACDQHRILFLSTPFEAASADLLDALGIAAFKIPSGELTNLPFLAHVARKGKPIILSTGMATLEEVEAAVQAVRRAGPAALVLLHCVSQYPAAPANANLRAMRTMADAFGVPVGFSDHTLGLEVALAAVALGACVLEKHFTLDRALPGPDHRASLEPGELSALVQGIRTVESALGDGRKAPAASEADTALAARKSLVAAVDIPAGATLTPDMIVIKRPGSGLPPGALDSLLGRVARQRIAGGALLRREWFT
jgi:N-acetylneuraminate synthase